MMINLQMLRDIKNPRIIVVGNHRGIIQSMLDFDYLAGKKEPGIKLIVGASSGSMRYFWGDRQIRIRGIRDIGELKGVKDEYDFFVIAESGRRVLDGVVSLTEAFMELKGGVIFAESVPERHALRLRQICQERKLDIFGPSSVGILVPGIMKLGAIGGTQPDQIAHSKLEEPGFAAVVSTSGGMINEIIASLARHNINLSFAAAIGGERFPVQTPASIVESALNDPHTKTIFFFGELGGTDEYVVGDLVKKHKNGKKKQMIAYIAGSSAESLSDAPQFGHAKALANSVSESATRKREYLRDSGFVVAETYREFELLMQKAAVLNAPERGVKDHQKLLERKEPLFSSRLSSDSDGVVSILGKDLLSFVEGKELTEVALSMFLGHAPKSRELVRFFDLSTRLLVDHGPQVSGVVSTMIAARAGKDLPSALASGILTIGPKFGGAINQAAKNWLGAIEADVNPNSFVESFAKKRQYIAGIGHKKYRVDNPDPRVKLLLDDFLKSQGAATRFALDVEGITTKKKSQLILNVDGVVAALMIDTLHDYEDYTYEEIKRLIETEFFNAVFVYARTTGLIAHYIDQKRLGDDLFRLPSEYISLED